MRLVNLQTKATHLLLLTVTAFNMGAACLAENPQTAKQETAGDNEEADLSKLADTAMLEGKTAKANEQYQALLNLLEKRYGNKDQRLSPVLIKLGSVQESLGNHTKAMSFYQRALALTEKGFGHYSPEFADNLVKLGKSYENSGNKATARKHYREAIKVLSKEPGLSASKKLKQLLHDYPDLIQEDDNSNQMLLKDYEKEFPEKGNKSSLEFQPTYTSTSSVSDSYFSRTPELSQEDNLSPIDENTKVQLRSLSASPANLAPAFQTLSQTIFKQVRLNASENYYKRKIAIDASALGKTHPGLANDLCALALLYVSRGNYPQAQVLFQNALDIYEGNWGKENQLSLSTRAALKTVEDFRSQGN